MPEDNERVIKFCVECGSKIEPGVESCPNCGESVIKLTPNEMEKIISKDPLECPYCHAKLNAKQIYCSECGRLMPSPKRKDTQGAILSQPGAIIRAKKEEYQRTCSGCGSIITSTILDQCPICNAKLEPLPPQVKIAQQQNHALVFTDKKLQPEKKIILSKETWNVKEGLNVFTSSLITYIFAMFIIIIFVYYQAGFGDPTAEVKIDITLILISQVPGIIFGITPLWYIFSNKHYSSKVGFNSDSNKLIFALIIGIIGGLILLGLNYIVGLFQDLLVNFGLTFFDAAQYTAEENEVIRSSGLFWLIILLILVAVQAFSTELVFRGVLQNTLKNSGKFKKNASGKVFLSIVIALIYAGVNSLFSFPTGLVFFLLNFLVFLILGLLYEINGNIFNTIFASILYHSLIVIFLYAL